MSSATSFSRQGLALRVLRAGLRGKSCCRWMGSGRGDKAQERERVHPCNVCDKAFKSLQMPSQHKIWYHSGKVFAFKGCGKKFNPNNSINRHDMLVWGKPHHRARTTIEEIILNLNVWGVEEKKRTVLTRSWKRADMLYPLKWKSIVLVFNQFVCVMFFFIFFAL